MIEPRPGGAAEERRTTLSPSFLKGGLLLVEGVVLRVKIELARAPSRLHPVTAIDRRSLSTSVTCTNLSKVQDKSPGHVACKALYPSSILGAASSKIPGRSSRRKIPGCFMPWRVGARMARDL